MADRSILVTFFEKPSAWLFCLICDKRLGGAWGTSGVHVEGKQGLLGGAWSWGSFQGSPLEEPEGLATKAVPATLAPLRPHPLCPGISFSGLLKSD